jgi:hypothetical protein
MPDPTTTDRDIPYPVGTDLIPAGPAEMRALAAEIDTENRGEIDYLQAGITLSTDWSFTAAIENAGTGALKSVAATGGICWLPLAAIGLARSLTASAALAALKPASLPGSGHYMSVGFELTASKSDKPAVVSVVSGIEEATAKLAEEHVPATTAGKARIRNIVLLNTAGVYSIVSQADVRPWCTGGGAPETKAEGRIGAGAVTSPKIAASLALTGVPTASTAAAETNTTQLATTAFVETAKAEAEAAAAETDNPYEGQVVRVRGAENEAHATRDVSVAVEIRNITGTAADVQISVSGVPIATLYSDGTHPVSYGFTCPAALKWRAYFSVEVGAVWSSYLVR